MVRINSDVFINEKKIKKYYITTNKVRNTVYYIPGVELGPDLKFNFDVRFISYNDCKKFISEFHKKYFEREKIIIKLYNGKEIPANKIDGFYLNENEHENEIVIISGEQKFIYNKYNKNDFAKITKDMEKLRKILMV
jgi:hypothetical protein